MAKEKRKIELAGHEFSHQQGEMAWKRIGFEKGRDEVLSRVRDLSLEERVDLLTDLFIEDMAKLWLAKWFNFQVELGKNPIVSREEMIESVGKTFTDGDDVEWDIKEWTFHNMRVFPEDLAANLCNENTVEEVRAARRYRKFK